MSAPSALPLNRIAGRVLAPATHPPPLHRRLVPGQRDRRSADPIAVLAREHDLLCREAVDAAEIAAGLEAAGLSDRTVRERYGLGSVFDLGDALFDLVPRRLEAPPRPANPWRYPVSRHLVRGLLYALPTLPYMTALQLVSGSPRDVLTLAAGGMLAMAVTQGLAYAGYLLAGRGRLRAAARTLWRAVVVAAVAGGALALAGVATGLLNPGPALLVYIQLVYVLAATLIMVFERDRLLMLTLVPGAAVATVLLTVPERGGPLEGPLFGLLGGCLLAVVLVARRTARQLQRVRDRGGSFRLSRSEARQAGVHALYGAAVAGLLSYAVLDPLFLDVPVSANSVLGIGMLPVVLALGVTEWHLHGFRSDAEVILERTYDIRSFAQRTRRSLLRRASAYAAALIVLTAAVLGPLQVGGSVESVLIWRHVGYGVIGLALFFATVLVSCGLVARALPLMGLALLVDVTVRSVAGLPLLALTLAHVAVYAALLSGLAATTMVSLASPLRLR